MVGLIAATACSKETSASSSASMEHATSMAETVSKGQKASIYGADGELLPSSEKQAGLALPRGITPFRTEERRHIYRSPVSVDKVVQYFGERLITGEVQKLGEGTVFRRAIPRDARGNMVELEVSVLPSSSTGTRIEIRELRAPPAKPMSPEELKKRVQKAQRTWD